MGWLPSPADPRKDWMGYEFAIILLDSGMLGGPEINLVYRVKTDAQWSSIGASDGNVYMAEAWDVPNFPAWWDGIKAEINERLAWECARLGNAPALSISSTIGTPPQSWAEFRTWLRDNLIWNGATHANPAGLFPLYISRAFAGGYGFDFGVEADGSPACRVNTPQGWKKMVVQ